MFGFFFIGWLNLQSESNGFYFINPGHLRSDGERLLVISIFEYFSLPAFLKETISIFMRLCTHNIMISRLYFKVLESSSLKQPCTRQTSTSVSTHSSPLKFTLEKVSTYKSTSKATKVVCLCSWRTAVRHQLQIQMIQDTTPWSRTGKHQKDGVNYF